MKNVTLIIIMLTALSFGFAMPLGEIPNLRNPQAGIYTSGQPNEGGFEHIAAAGFKTVINVLPEKNCVPGEADMVISQQMTYRTVPFHLTNFRKETIEQFAEVLKKAEKPVLIHCGTGNHAGGLWFAYRVLIQKAPVEVAAQEGRIIGMRKDLENSLHDWVLKNRKEF